VSGSESNEGRIVHVYEAFHPVHQHQDASPDDLIKALGEALKKAADATDPGPEGWYKLELFGKVTRNSPGWFDGFAIRVSTPPS
jgi:hypothetical protein